MSEEKLIFATKYSTINFDETESEKIWKTCMQIAK